MRAEGPRLGLEAMADGGDLRIVVTGELDLATAAALRRGVLDHARDGRGAVILDVAGVEFIDSMGLRSLLMLRSDLASERRRLVLHAGGGPVIRLLRLTGTAGVFSLE